MNRRELSDQLPADRAQTALTGLSGSQVWPCKTAANVDDDTGARRNDNNGPSQSEILNAFAS